MIRSIIVATLLAVFVTPAHAAMMEGDDKYELEPLIKDKDWQMSAELGFLLTSGNNDSTSLLGKVDASHDWQKWRLKYELNTLLKRDEKYDEATETERLQTTAERYFFKAQGDYELSQTNSIFGLYSYLDDRFGQYVEYITMAAGYSFRAINKKKMYLDLNLGPGYAKATSSLDEKEEGVTMIASAAYNWEISDSARFTQNFSYQKASFNNLSISESALVTKISNSMQMKVSFRAEHNDSKNTDSDIKSLNTQTSVTLVVNI